VRTRAPVLVGRDNELRNLGEALSSARDGHGGAVFVTGEGGIGKSRLVSAAADLAFAADMSLLRGRGSPIGPMVPFRSLTEAIMSVLRAGDQIDVAELGPYRAVLARLIPGWGTPAADEGGSLVVLAEAVLRLAGLVGRSRGCLLILDDLQDADAETLAVVDYLASNLARQPIVLLGTVRTDPGPALELARSAAQRHCGTLIELPRLSRYDVRQLAGACLGTDPCALPEQVMDHLWANSEGIPLLAEELLNDLLSRRQLVRGSQGWRVTGPLRATVPGTLARTMMGRLDRIGPQGRELLSVAAAVGRRFPLAVLQAATLVEHRDLLSHLHAEGISDIVAPDEETPDWYAFRHPLVAEALLSLLSPAERGRLARQAATAVDAVYPGLPGEWCQLSAALHLQAGDRSQAGRLFTEAGRRALAQGAANSAVTLLDKAVDLLTGHEDAPARAAAFAALLHALTEAGMVERALRSAAELDRLNSVLSPGSRVQMHTSLAWAAAVAGRTSDGLAQLEAARKLLGPDAPGQDTAPVDVVAAHLALDMPGPDQVRIAEALARRAADAAGTAGLPAVACQAWQLLGALSRSRDPDEATTCLERALHVAVRHDLPIEEIHTLIRLGNDDALRDGSLGRLEQAQLAASRAGAVTSRYQADSSLALQAILRGDFAAAQALIDQVVAATTRLGLVETTRYALLLRAVLGAHRGRRRDMEAALTEMHGWGSHAQLAPRIHGLAQAWCALLEEDRSRALQELSAALAAEENSPTVFQLTGRYGLHLLLCVLEGTAGQREYQSLTAAPVSRLRWDRQFALFASAVLAGRAGEAAGAAEAVTEALRVGAPYATGRHLGLRLVSEAALGDGWGTPAGWLRAAEEYFHTSDVPAVASACRALLRRAGVSVTQRRSGAGNIPPALRAAGVTVREQEVLLLLRKRLSNREIAARLHLSPRTVEKHVASLIVKTGQPDRIALGKLAGEDDAARGAG
jgi:AAA ATPase domain/Bacterial regulatory proteins, luxR family